MSSTHHTNPSVNTIANEALGYISETTAIALGDLGSSR